MLSIDGFTPQELGLPAKFSEFRPGQVEAIDHVLNCPDSIIPMSLPLGSGKSLIALAIARATGLRTVILTATKGLQRQYLDDFSSSGLYDIRGRGNYQCGYYTNINCRLGQLESCPLVGDNCDYEFHRDIARRQMLLITNYSYWLNVNKFPPGLQGQDEDSRPVEQLILDEAHACPQELSKFLQVEIRESWLKTANITWHSYRDLPDEISPWRALALNHLVSITHQLADAVKAAKLTRDYHSRSRVHDLSALKTALESISTMDGSSWVLESTIGSRYGRQWIFDNIWPASHSNSLFQSVPKIILMSGTLRPATLRLLGIPPDRYHFREFPRVFPAQHTPVYYIPTVKMNAKIDDEGLGIWVRRIDEVIESRLDRKGIIHTVSYARQKYLQDHSKFSRYFFANTNDPESPSAAEVVAAFRTADAPAILVSPSFSTGWDFKGRQCEFQVIAKVPYPDFRSKIIQARAARSPSYASQIAMQDIEQACGRGSRSFYDRCEIFVIDNAIKYLLYRYPGLKSRWFSLIELTSLPSPGPRCPEEGQDPGGSLHPATLL